MELYGGDVVVGRAHAGDDAVFGHGGGDEAGGDFFHVVAVAHPHLRALGHAGEERTFPVRDDERGAPVFPGGGTAHGPAVLERGQLHAVADAEDRQPEVEKSLGQTGRIGFEHAARPAGDDQAGGRARHDLFDRRVPGQDLAVHFHFAHAAGDELGVLRAAVENDDVVHEELLSRIGKSWRSIYYIKGRVLRRLIKHGGARFV